MTKEGAAAQQIPAGAWFGALIGSTVWVPFFVVFQIGQHPAFAIANLVFCLGCIVAGIFFWFGSNRLSSLVSMQLLLLISFLPSAATIVSAVYLKVSEARPSLLWVLLVYPYTAVYLLWMVKLQAWRSRQAVEGRRSPGDV